MKLSRRNFFKALAGLGAAVAMPQTAQAEEQVPGVEELVSYDSSDDVFAEPQLEIDYEYPPTGIKIFINDREIHSIASFHCSGWLINGNIEVTANGRYDYEWLRDLVKQKESVTMKIITNGNTCTSTGFIENVSHTFYTYSYISELRLRFIVNEWTS